MATTRRQALMLAGGTSLAAAGMGIAAAGSRSAAAQERSPVGPVPRGLRPGGELDKVIAESAARDVFSGSVLITYRGRTVLSRSYGMADKARKIPNGPDTMFGLASVSKLFTAVSVTQLAQRGKLLYRDTVGKYLDGFSPEVANRVTIHHLLTHTSGLRDFFGAPGYFEEARKWTSVAQQTAGIGRFVRQETLAFQPGASHQYSNSGYHVLSEIIERISGQQVQDYIREHIFRASGMGSAGFYSKAQWRDDRRFAHGYYRPPGSADRIDNIDEQGSLPGAFASCAQLERFAHALWEEKLLDQAHTRLTLSPKVPTAPPQGSDLVTFEGYGPIVTLGGEHWSYGHNGGSSIGGVIEFVFYPDSGYVTVFMSNHEMDSIRGIPSLARRLIITS